MTFGSSRLSAVNGAASISDRPRDTGDVGSVAPLSVKGPPSGQTDAHAEIKVAMLGEGFVVGYLSVLDAARFLGMGTTFVEGLIASEEIRSYKFGRSRKIRVLDLEQWASEQRENR